MHLSPGHLKVVLILALLQDLQIRPQKDIFRAHLERDLRLCPACFAGQRWQCEEIFEDIAEPSDWSKLLKSISLLFDRREIYFLQLNGGAQLVAKRKAIEQQPYRNVDSLRREFLEMEERPGGFQLCRSGSRTPRFVSYFEQRGHEAATIWYYMMHSVTPLLMQELFLLEFPVPRSYGACGLTHFQAYAGRTLVHYAAAVENLRLEMARQLLQLSLKLTFGFADFRIFLTDLTADNLAFDEPSQRVILIDLDSVVLVDASAPLGNAQKYEPLPGDGFTFDVKEFCGGQQLDANVYQACRLLKDFLLQDLANDRLEMLLGQCVRCDNETCDMRFQQAYDLIKLLGELLDR
ncbi:divergent protein kinase domain 2A [Drosophila obscura]|uniref:divergent protein kinase domain 2A n=1 Tax=Drosophila obscura TaxID=7282 RepID=UPI001BB1D527|nr:divergent protein kinase domain 2A [Drosophila obscura]